ncbi:hypothetical protein ACPCUK_27660 [Streptomyces arboris]|uniref:hypothetical protein n=1 Tax=Streptomyces arboris TaxID=2600619 RepID=UPI003C303671
MTSVVIALVALVVSLISLGWQIITWLRSGPVIKVKGHSSIAVVDGNAGEVHLSVTAVNRGRAPATVTGWGLRLPNGSSVVPQSAQLPGTNPLPHRLEPHAEASWHVPQTAVEEACRTHHVELSQVRPFVDVSGRGQVLGKRL